MPRFTAAYSSFKGRLKEVELLRRSAANLERQDAVGNSDMINALCRSSVVLLSSHVEGYIKDLGELTLDSISSKLVSRKKLAPRFFYHVSKAALGEIRDTEDPDKVAEKVFSFINIEGVYWSKDGAFSQAIDAEKFSKGFSNPGTKLIQKYLNRFGFDTYQTDLKAKLGANYHPALTMVDNLVDTRNKIAHGNVLISKTPLDLKSMVRLVVGYCAATDSVFATWCQKNICGIR